MRRVVAFLMLLFSWPVSIVHRAVNDMPLDKVRWIVFDKSIEQSVAWYICDTGRMVSVILFIFGVWLLCGRLGKMVYFLISALLILSIIDLVHYWLWFQRNEYVVFIEGLVMIGTPMLIFKHESNRNSSHEKTN